MPKSRTGVVDAGVAQRLARRRRRRRRRGRCPRRRRRSRCARASHGERARRAGIDPARVDDRDPDALVGEPLGDLEAESPPSRRRRRAARPSPRVAAQHVDAADALERRDVGGHGALREAHARSGRRRPRPPRAARSRSVARRRAARRAAGPGTTCSIDRSHMPLWLGAVVAGDAGPVEHERDAGSRCSATSISTWSNARLRNVA